MLYCLFTCVALTCTVHMTCTGPDFIDLGFNGDIEDKCDYLDYLETDHDQRKRTVIQLNIRGLLNKQDDLRQLLVEIKKKHAVSVILLAETWLKKSTQKKIRVPGYQFVGSHRECKRGGGVSILISNKLQFRKRKDLTLDIPNFENITIELKTHKDSILFSALYRPPNTKETEFIKNYKRLLNKFNPEEISRLILGLDHNVDFLKHEKHRPTKEFIELNLDYHLLPSFTKPTRITKTSSTLIDNIIIGKIFQMSYEPIICISDISDHLPLVLSIDNIDPFKAPKTKICTRKLDNKKMETLNNRFQDVDWTTDLHDKDANESFNTLYNFLSDQLNDIAPVKMFEVSDKKIIKNKWLTSGLLKSMTKQRKLYKKNIA